MKYLDILMVMLVVVLLSGCSLDTGSLSGVSGVEDTAPKMSVYQNKLYGFSLQHPSEWKIDEDDGRVVIKSSENTGCSCGGPVAPEEGEMLTVSVHEASDETIEDIREERISDGCTVSEIQKINGIDFFQYENCPDCCASYPGYTTVKDGLTYDFYSTYWPWNDETDHYFNEIIQTIQFE